MNQYRCETCKHHLYDMREEADMCGVTKWFMTGSLWSFIENVGCVSHSDFQNQREKILDETYAKLKQKMQHGDHTMILDMRDVDKVFEELRGEQ
jgi:hypothetical protein